MKAEEQVFERKVSYNTENDVSHADFIESQESIRNLAKLNGADPNGLNMDK